MSNIELNLSFDQTKEVRAVKSRNAKEMLLPKWRKKSWRKGRWNDKRKNRHCRQDSRHEETLHQNGAPKVDLSLFTSAQRQSLPGPSVTDIAESKGSTSVSSVPSSCKPIPVELRNPSKYVAIDCEMVGTGPRLLSALARCSIVSYDGDVIYDKFIKPRAFITDYRTRWSGIRPRDLVNATPFAQAKLEILKLIKGKVVIGHAVHNDFKAIGYSHPAELTRDTSRISLLNRKAGFEDQRCASLKNLTKAIFGRDIQTGRKGHSSVEDAKATMELYKVVENEWETMLASKSKST
ncbi:interferon-stimulated 20 kDa exonuclease-like 2 [Pholidichthys leucotaenia]